MKISGNYTLDATRDEVWTALNDLNVLARVVPGCERLEQTGENEYEGIVKIGIASIKGSYSGKIRLEEITPPTHYKLVMAGKSANGVVDGAGTVDLEELDGKTVLHYGGDAQIGGQLASVGQRLIEGASRQLINQSLKSLAAQIEQRRTPGAPAPAATDAAHAPALPSPDAPAALPASAPVPAAPPSPADEAPKLADLTEPASSGAPGAAEATVAQAAAAPQRRVVVVPPEEQLRPESVVTGMVGDLIKDKPWLPWVIVAFLLGLLLGRRG